MCGPTLNLKASTKWWNVMCLTYVTICVTLSYKKFQSLGYPPLNLATCSDGTHNCQTFVPPKERQNLTAYFKKFDHAKLHATSSLLRGIQIVSITLNSTNDEEEW